MKITESQLRKIIAEEIQKFDPFAVDKAINNFLDVVNAEWDSTFSEKKSVMTSEEKLELEKYLDGLRQGLYDEIYNQLGQIDNQIDDYLKG